MSLVFGDISKKVAHDCNLLWRLFTVSDYQTQFVDWEKDAQSVLAIFRGWIQSYLGNTGVTHLINDLSDMSPAFHKWWPRHDILDAYMDYKQVRHPTVGLLVLQANTYQVINHPDLLMGVFTPVAGTDTADKLALLSRQTPPVSVIQ